VNNLKGKYVSAMQKEILFLLFPSVNSNYLLLLTLADKKIMIYPYALTIYNFEVSTYEVSSEKKGIKLCHDRGS
jgi:hypothetical protein